MTINNNYFTTTKKYSNFLNGPMGEKGVQEIPSIGIVSAMKLRQIGFEKAYHILGLVMCEKEDSEKVLKEVGVRNHRVVCETMREYQRQFI